MPIAQFYNKKTKRWVKYRYDSKGSKILNVKQVEPKRPFKGVTKRGSRP